MKPTSTRWKEISISEYEWERAALRFLRERLPDHEPYRAWSNFEFLALDGSLNEVDVLVLSKKGLFLVEIKSWPGIVKGDASTWTVHHNGRRSTHDNPLLLAHRKARKLKSLLLTKKPLQKVGAPYIEAFVFLSHEEVDCRFPPALRERVHTRDREPSDPALPQQAERLGIIAALTRWKPEHPPRRILDRPIAKAVTRALEEAGIRPSQKVRRVGDYKLDELLFDGPGYQDWSARHVSLKRDESRVRVYSVELGASSQTSETLTKAARREYEVLSEVMHEGILKARYYTESDRGPALIFDHYPGSQRFDHFLAERCGNLGADERLNLLRQVAEAIRYAHQKRLVHRALSPQSILVIDPELANPRLKVFNWQTGARAPGSAESSGKGLSPTSNVNDLVEDASVVYIAPEALSERGGTGEQQDVFSLGAIAYHLFSGHPPAADFYELRDKLREDQGLKISSVLDGVTEGLQYLVQFSTCPGVEDRFDTVDEVLECLDQVEDELTTPEHEDLVRDPTMARAGDRIGHPAKGRIFEVKRRLGKGSTALALLVVELSRNKEEGGGKEQVLKVALEPSCNERLRSEGEVLEQLRRHSLIVQLDGVIEIGDRVGLLMDKAGDRTLAGRLRQEGRLHLEMLERFGDDLLQTVDWLEQEGVPHRDIKPENLGVAPMGRLNTLRLVLFDFSLARTPAENIRAGTVPYLDPFLILREPPRWDTHAERFAAAVTLYQMATGQLPRWGDGRSDPAMLKVEVSLDVDLFEPALRDEMTAFFAKALQRDYKQRFDNAEEMRDSWRKIFARAGEPVVVKELGEPAAPGEAGAPSPPVLDEVTLPTPLVLLGLSTRALNALDRVGASTVEDLLRTPFQQVSHMRGVGSKTRKELARFIKELAERFPDVERMPLVRAEDPSEVVDVETLGIDAIAGQLLSTHGRAKASRKALSVFLRLAVAADTSKLDSGWPSQSDAARELDVSRERMRQYLATARRRWLDNPAVTSVREEVASLLDMHAGVMTTAELADALLSRRGSAQTEPLRTRQAHAVARAAIETERGRAEPRWLVRRLHDGAHLLVARNELDEDGEALIDGQRLADYAERLGRKADELAMADPLLPPDRVVEALQAVVVPTGLTPPTAIRLRQLAAATSKRASLSSRLELYPRAMTARRALRLSLGALAGARELTPEQVRERVSGRYPEAEPLPERPELDTLLEEVGCELRWRPEARSGEGAYVALLREFTTVQSATSFSRSPRVMPRFEEVSADEAEIKQFQKRLLASVDQHHFLALIVSPRQALVAERALRAHFDLEACSFDEILLRHMKRFAAAKKVEWQVVLWADAAPRKERASSQDWTNLLRVVRAALPRVREELEAKPRHLLLTHPGLLARYGQLAFLDELRDSAGRPGGPPGLWILVPTDAQDEKPTLDGQPVPVFTTAQWARIPESWLAARSKFETGGSRGG